jgi:two-component system, cell cycle sensor histidine kinase and response regulator CckA
VVKPPTSLEMFFGRLAHTLRLRGPLATDPTARTLHAFLLTLATWYFLWTAILIPLNPNPNAGLRLSVASVAIVTPLAALVLLRRGRLREASLAYLAGMWIFTTTAMALQGGVRSTIQVLYVTLPISAAWLLGYIPALWTACVCLGTALVFALLETSGVTISRVIPGTPLGVFATLVQASVIGAVPAARVLRTLREEVAEHRRTEQALRESEGRFRNMADTAPVHIVLFGPDRRATFFNKARLDFTGRGMEQELGKGWIESIHPDDRERCTETFFPVKDVGSQSRIEYRVRRADGEYRSLLCSVVPRFAPEGTFVGYIASSVDITELKRSQEEGLARQKLESLGVLATGIAHDFNNLLSGILANTELLRAELGENPEAQGIVKSVDTLALRAVEFVRQLMIYAGQESAVLEEVDLAGVVREMLQLMRVSISKNAALKVELPPEKQYFIQANAAQIRQVVMNLITNASDALEGKDGVICVTLEHVQPDHDLLSGDSLADPAPGLADRDFLRLGIADTGRGMTPEVRARIFDPFFTTKSAGRGLGLSAVQGIIRSHGGTIRVESAPGQGSRFEILLPCVTHAEQDHPDIVIPASVGEGGRFSATILLIDDEDPLRLAVAEMLRRRGFFVYETGDGRAGVDLFQAQAPQIDIVLLDVTLPGMSGSEILAELRKIRPGVKVILTTAYGRDHATAVMGAEQSCPYVRKPYQINDLTDTIRRTVEDRRTKLATR